MGDVTEPIWEKFLPLHDYLKESFPLLYVFFRFTCPEAPDDDVFSVTPTWNLL